MADWPDVSGANFSGEEMVRDVCTAGLNLDVGSSARKPVKSAARTFTLWSRKLSWIMKSLTETLFVNQDVLCYLRFREGAQDYMTESCSCYYQ